MALEPLRLVGEPEPSAEAMELAADGALRVNDCAAFLGVSRSRVYELLRSGALRGARLDGRRVVFRASAQRYLAAHLDGP